MIKGIVFDLDGVILNSMGYWRSVYRRYLHSVNIEIDPTYDNELVPYTFDKAYCILKDKYDLKMTLEEFLDGVFTTMKNSYKNEIEVEKNVLEVLPKLKAMGIKMSVATNTDYEMIIHGLKKYNLIPFFESIKTVKEVGVGKNDGPDIYVKTMEDMGLSISETLVVEDAVHGAKSAHRANFIVAGVYDESAAYMQEELKAECEYYMNDLSDIFAVLEDIK